MVRSSVAATAAFVLLASGLSLTPVPLAAQERPAAQAQTPAPHEVVRGNTLWDLAQHFYGDPWQWPRIYDANRDRVEDPHWIYPGQVLRIPDLETGEIREVTVIAREEGDPATPRPGEQVQPGVPADTPVVARPVGVIDPTDRRGPKPLTGRTAFWPDTTQDRFAGAARAATLPPVSREDTYAARWLVPFEGMTDHLGQIAGFAGAEEVRSQFQTLKPFDQLRVTFDGGVPAVGTLLQAFRVDQSLHEVARIAVPTGLLEVTQVHPAGAVVVVRNVYDRMRPGDLIRRAPDYPLLSGQEAIAVADGPMATVLGFASNSAIKGIGEQLFLDAGAEDGVRVGDEYVLVWTESDEGWGTEVEGRLHVLAVQQGYATARITDVTNPVFERGVRVRLSKRLP